MHDQYHHKTSKFDAILAWVIFFIGVAMVVGYYLRATGQWGGL